jgi:hypothetical protein
MAYDEDLANRLREQLQAEDGVTEKRMFSGLAFLLDGHMTVNASGQGGLMLRIDPSQSDELVRQPGVRRFVMRGKELDGWLRVDPAVIETDDALAFWVGHGVRFARSLPPK